MTPGENAKVADETAAKIQRAIGSTGAAVIALDIMNANGLSVAAELAQAFHEVAQGIQIAQSVGMRFVFVAVRRGSSHCLCMPLMDLERAAAAMAALRQQLVQQGCVAEARLAWIFVPQALREQMLPLVERTWSDIVIH